MLQYSILVNVHVSVCTGHTHHCFQKPSTASTANQSLYLFKFCLTRTQQLENPCNAAGLLLKAAEDVSGLSSDGPLTASTVFNVIYDTYLYYHFCTIVGRFELLVSTVPNIHDQSIQYLHAEARMAFCCCKYVQPLCLQQLVLCGLSQRPKRPLMG